MKSLLLDRTDWDLTLDTAGNIAVCTEPYAIAQDVACAVRLFKGELYYDTTQGIPYWSEILAETPPLALLRARIAAAALTVSGVVSAVCYITSIKGRTVQGQVQFTDSTGKTQAVSF